MRWRWIAGLLALLAVLMGTAQAAVLNGRTDSRGQLATAQTAAGVSANSVDFGPSWKGRWLYVLYRNTAGSATVHGEVNCAPPGSAAFATSWVVIAGSTKTLAVGADAFNVEQPACAYQTVVDSGTCAGCSVNVTYLAGPELQ